MPRRGLRSVFDTMISCETTPDLSIIVPVCNEQGILPDLFSALDRQVSLRMEIIFCDGQSTDATCSLIRDYQQRSCHDVQLISTVRRRACQMNAGARHSRWALLLFLHADSGWTEDDLLLGAVKEFQSHQIKTDVALVAHFKLQFTGHDSPRFYRYLAAKSALNLPGTVFGDQGLMVTRHAWSRAGGYDESLPILEDVEVVQRLMLSGQLFLLSGTLTTSSRRYQRDGVLRRQLENAVLLILYSAGYRSLLPEVLGSYQTEVLSGSRAPGLFRWLHQLPLSAYCRFWFGCGSAQVRYFWLIPYRLYWWVGKSPTQAESIAKEWQRVVQPLIDTPLVHVVWAVFSWIVYYVFVLLNLPRWDMTVTNQNSIDHKRRNQ